MNLKKGMGDFFALDIGTNAVRVVQLSASGANNWTLVAHGYAPSTIKDYFRRSLQARRRLGDVIITALGQSGIKTKKVLIRLPLKRDVYNGH